MKLWFRLNVPFTVSLLVIVWLLCPMSMSLALADENQGIQSDKRITSLTNLIRNLAVNGVTAEEAVAIAHTLNNHNNPPLSDSEVEAAVKSVYSKPLSAEADTNNLPAVAPEKKVEAPGGQPPALEIPGAPSWAPKVLGMQFDGIYQGAPAFKSPYSGPNSFQAQSQLKQTPTQTYGVYLGSQLSPTLQAYLDLEFFKGNGVSRGLGLGGYINGDVIRAGSSNIPQTPYVARAYLRYYVPLGPETQIVQGKSCPLTETLERCQDALPGDQPVSRWEIKLGKMAAADDFDQNRYANNNRTQFFNYDFLFNTAWDYAADTRGYTYGLSTTLFQPKWNLAFGVYMEPNTQNGAIFDWLDWRELGYNLQLTLKPNDAGTVVRLLSYMNTGRMGSYEEALAEGRATSSAPSILSVESENISGIKKYGFGLNFEQPVMDNGETGIFGRLGWNDGHHETWAYVEVDRHASLGFQLSGIHWSREDDRVGVAYGVNGLSNLHKEYLEAGGIGMLLGDGKLNYSLEQVMEAYYKIHVSRYAELTPDFQYIQNPGYNRDRGPAEVYGIRLHLNY